MKTQRRRWAKAMRELRRMDRTGAWTHKRGANRVVKLAEHFRVNILFDAQRPVEVWRVRP
jgi:hypothetical protein